MRLVWRVLEWSAHKRAELWRRDLERLSEAQGLSARAAEEYCLRKALEAEQTADIYRVRAGEPL